MDSIQEKQLAKLFQEYEAAPRPEGTNVELEIRIKEDIDRETYESLVTAAKTDPDFSPPVIDMSANIISTKVHGDRDTGQSIRKITYSGDSSAEEFIRKTRLMNPIIMEGFVKYSVGLSTETMIGKFPSTNDSIVRFKVRISFNIKEPAGEPKWRLDITAIKMGTFKNLSPVFKSIRQELFGSGITTENILQELNYELISGYEVEIEYIGGAKAPADLKIVDKVFGLLNRNYTDVVKYQDEIYNVAKVVVPANAELFQKPTHRIKQLSNQVVSLSMNTYYNEIYPPNGYYATEKADGVRTIVSSHGAGTYLLFSDGMKFVPGAVTKQIIVDAEYVAVDEKSLPAGNKKTPAKPSIYIFDCIMCGEDFSSKGFEFRVEKLAEAAAELQKILPEHNVIAKKFARLGATPRELEDALRSVYRPDDAPYEVDGVILTAPGKSYRDTENYKWKPYENNTIDFLAVKCPKNLLGIQPYVNRRQDGLELYILFVGISHQQREKLGIGLIEHYKSIFPGPSAGYYPVQFSASVCPLAYIYYHNGDIDRQIVELSRNRANTEWIYHRTRTDRALEKGYYGNDYRIAELTFSNYIDPFDFESLWQVQKSYFLKTSDNIYVAANKFKRFVISLLLKDNISGAKWIIDAAAGRGADLHRYQEIGVENALFIDIDKTAITELIRRKFAFTHTKKRHVRSWIGADDSQMEVVTKRNMTTDIEYDKLLVKDTKNLTVHTLVADLKTSADVLVEKVHHFGINTESVDGIVCNFAIHYMCGTAEELQNFIQFVSRLLKTDGVFIFTTMDGSRVYKLLEDVPRGGTWQVEEGGVVKYALQKDYDGKLAKYGQTISVKLPFSNEMYSEPLCNIDYVVSVATKYGLSLEQNSSMETYIEKFKKADRGLYDRLTPNDIQYNALHSYVTLRKVK